MGSEDPAELDNRREVMAKVNREAVSFQVVKLCSIKLSKPGAGMKVAAVAGEGERHGNQML